MASLSRAFPNMAKDTNGQKTNYIPLHVFLETLRTWNKSNYTRGSCRKVAKSWLRMQLRSNRVSSDALNSRLPIQHRSQAIGGIFLYPRHIPGISLCPKLSSTENSLRCPNPKGTSSWRGGFRSTLQRHMENFGSYWCLAGNEGMIHKSLVIIIPFPTFPSIPYVYHQ